MIQYFEKIENLGVFSNYKKPADMAPFERYNLIYGLNGSGKTTLSRFFADLNKGLADGFPDLKYKIKTEDGDFQQGAPYPRNVRVFNPEYVDANIGELEGTLNPIFVIGEENKTLAEAVKVDEARLSTLTIEHDAKDKELKKLEIKKGKIFTNVAPQITKATQGATLRTYNKNHAVKAYDKLASPIQLSVQELAGASTAMKQSVMDGLAELATPKIPVGGTEESFFAALELHRESVLTILLKNATSAAIDRLKTSPEIAAWVERGREVHAQNDDHKCEYCQQAIPESREVELAAHFNKSDSTLKNEIENAMTVSDMLRGEIERGIGSSEKTLYPELRDEFLISTKALGVERSSIISHLESLKEALADKLARRNESYELEIPSFNSSAWDGAMLSLNSLIRRHNAESSNFQTRLDDNFTKIETHFLSSVGQEVKGISAEIETLKGEIEVCTNGNVEQSKLGIENLVKRISKNRALISNSHQAALDLSQKLASFLGRDDLKFEPEGDGYRIVRGGRPAKRLSEGEKTAITFLYFVVGLKDQNFNLAEGIVVIDDPISSLDSSSVYQAFAYLKNAVKDAKQIFLFTHSFEFLKLLLNWFQHIPKPSQNGKSTYWMLHCSITSGTSREAEIKPLDKVLLENKNELAYLVKELITFESDGSIEQAYPIPNIIRKVLETFLEQHSTGKGPYQKLENIVFDDAQKSALYKFANDLSHPTLSGLDPALVGETKNNIKHLLEMIETVAPVHYKALTETIGT